MTPEQLVSEVSDLITLPRAYHRIREMLDDPRCGAADIGRVIQHEPALTAKVLRIANSAYYGLPSKIDTIPMAITVLGTRALSDLVLASAVASAFEDIDTDLVDMADFWHHSVYCGIMARLLSKHLRLGQSEQLFVGGLLHDLGKLVIYMRLPEQASEVLRLFAESERPLYEIEREVHGFDHADVGRALVASWDLPEGLQEAIGYHHNPQADLPYADEVALIHSANALSKKVEPGHKLRQDDNAVPELHPFVAERVPLTPELVEELSLKADVQSLEVFRTLFSGASTCSSYA
mgnify:FL=1